MAEPQRILISDATSYKAAVLARYCKRLYPRVSVWTADHRPASRLLHTRFSDQHRVLQNGPSRPEDYSRELAAIVREAEIDLVIPVTSGEMDALLRRSADFAGALDYWGDLETYRRLHRKDAFHQLASELGLRLPRRYASLAEIQFPAVAKPVSASSARGVVYLREPRDLESFAADEPYVFEEWIRGEAAGFACFARAGEILAATTHRRLAELPASGGSSVYREGLDDPRLRVIAERVLAQAPWSGFAMFEFKLAAGEPVLIEVNPRVWGSIHQGLAAGVNLLEPLLGPAELPADPDVRTYFAPPVYLAFAQYLLRGQVAPLVEFLRGLPRNRADVPLFADPRGYFASLLRLS